MIQVSTAAKKTSSTHLIRIKKINSNFERTMDLIMMHLDLVGAKRPPQLKTPKTLKISLSKVQKVLKTTDLLTALGHTGRAMVSSPSKVKGLDHAGRAVLKVPAVSTVSLMTQKT